MSTTPFNLLLLGKKSLSFPTPQRIIAGSTFCCNNAGGHVVVSSQFTSNKPQQQKYQYHHYHQHHHQRIRYYYTNADQVKKNDPYAILGLSYGDGATSQEIREAFRKQAAILHPDVNKTDPPTVAREKFQALQRAYEILLKNKTGSDGSNDKDDDEWRFKVWNQGDRIACDRTDVAGLKRQRPIIPPTKQETFRSVMIGHPSQNRTTGGRHRRGGEYLEDGITTIASTNQSGGTVGRGWNKWVDRSKVQYVPWNTKVVGASVTTTTTPTDDESSSEINNNNNQK